MNRIPRGVRFPQVHETDMTIDTRRFCPVEPDFPGMEPRDPLHGRQKVNVRTAEDEFQTVNPVRIATAVAPACPGGLTSTAARAGSGRPMVCIWPTAQDLRRSVGRLTRGIAARVDSSRAGPMVRSDVQGIACDRFSMNATVREGAEPPFG